MQFLPKRLADCMHEDDMGHSDMALNKDRKPA